MVQGVKSQFGLEKFGVGLTVLGLSLVGAYVYTWLASAGYWVTALQILTVAGAVHNFILRRFNE